MLSDPQKRAAYDQYGHAGVDPNMRPRPGGRRASAASPRRSATSSATSSAARRPAPRRRRQAGLSRQRPQLRDGDHARGSRHRQGHADPHPELGELRDLQGQRRQARHQPKTCTDLQRRRHGAHAPGLLQHPADLPATATAPARSFPSPAPPAAARAASRSNKTLEVKIPAGINEGMRIRSCRQRRAGHQRRPAGRSLHRDPHQAARRSSSATATTCTARCRSA